MLQLNLATALRTSANARLVQPFTHTLPIRLSTQVSLPTHCRFYATPGRPKTAVGETGRPIKRTVKKKVSTEKQIAAAEKAAARKAAAKQKAADKKKAVADKKKAVAAKQKADAEKKKAVAAKQKAEKKKADTAKKVAAAEKKKQTIAAKKVAARAKIQAANDAKKAKAAKPLTDKQLLDKRKAEVARLKKLALDPPKISYTSAYSQLVKKRAKDGSVDHLNEHKGTTSYVRLLAEENTRAYKALTLEEREHFNHLAHVSKEESLAAYRKWVHSHTVEEIARANRARASLRRINRTGYPGRLKKSWTKIEDERYQKMPLNAYARYTTSRSTSPDFARMSVAERSQLISKEWKALSESEKEKYTAIAAEERRQASEQFHEPPVQQQVAAAA